MAVHDGAPKLQLVRSGAMCTSRVRFAIFCISAVILQ